MTLKINPATDRVLSELKRRFEALYGDRLDRLLLFGSHARGDPEPASDVDVLVVLKGSVDSNVERDRTLDIVAGMSLENDVVISCVFMDQERFLTRQGPLLRNVRREGVPI